MVADCPRDGRSSLGFGCAGLFSLPAKSDRRRVLDAAYDLGIRHFDCAPIYGLGLAEAELGEFARSRKDVVIATKFGMQPTIIGRLAGRAQAPIRRFLQSSPTLRARLRAASTKAGEAEPETPRLSKVLYTSRDYSVETAESQLTASLRNLRVDKIEYFLLHEPAGSFAFDPRLLADWLGRVQDDGAIGQWGPAGDLSHLDANLLELSERAKVHQLPYDLVHGYRGPCPKRERVSITFGFIAETLPKVREMLARNSTLRQRCSESLDEELDDQVLAHLLIRDALSRNRYGIVLVSSTKVSNLQMACAAAEAPLRNEAEVTAMIKQSLVDGVLP